mmetsp:Transcript_74138/g.130857  ORF Transcript_74138/g.130857 Transcript_74138/m.130857 type:complete len:234 (-) Transcript_74138:1537-2238(-)
MGPVGEHGPGAALGLDLKWGQDRPEALGGHMQRSGVQLHCKPLGDVVGHRGLQPLEDARAQSREPQSLAGCLRVCMDPGQAVRRAVHRQVLGVRRCWLRAVVGRGAEHAAAAGRGDWKYRGVHEERLHEAIHQPLGLVMHQGVQHRLQGRQDPRLLDVLWEVAHQQGPQLHWRLLLHPLHQPRNAHGGIQGVGEPLAGQPLHVRVDDHWALLGTAADEDVLPDGHRRMVAARG